MTTIHQPVPESNQEKWKGIEGQKIDKQQEMDFTYTNIDKFIRLSLGENANFSNALYNGDYSLTLEEAQRRKYAFICDSLGIKEGSKVLDLGCGWGGFLVYLQKIGAVGIGVNLSSGQVAACLKSGLDAHLRDARFIKPEDFGIFDAVAALGSFEHVATVQDYLSDRQDAVYADYFRHVADLLPKGKRFYMQSMVFGKNMIPYHEIDITAPKGSDAYILALLTKHNPDSWLPYGGEHIIRVAAPYFKLIHHSSGRLDYIETNRQWTKRFLKFSLKKYLWFFSLVPEYLRNPEFRYQLDLLRVRPNRVCFERELMDHSRLVFEKI
jgi:cyclopropane-fatty-acyl-phospholipid synthase